MLHKRFITPTTIIVMITLILMAATVLSLLPLVNSKAVGTGEGGGRYSGRVLLVSMDGFRWDYLKTVTGLGNFSRLAATGCSVDYVDTPLSTMSFPAHYTIATGLYEESHGVVANHIYDPERNASFVKGTTESFWWDEGEPIWVTAERQNKTAGVHSWPGSAIRIRGYRPTSYLVWNKTLPAMDTVDTVISWLKDDAMDLVLLYVNEPDHTGHTYGPGSPQLVEKVREMDGFIGSIMNSLEEKQLNDVNLLVTSDHGMTDVNNTDFSRNRRNLLQADAGRECFIQVHSF